MKQLAAMALAGIALLGGCEAAAAAGVACSRSSECAAPLVCAYGRCHTQCVDARDCPVGARCIASTGGPVCSIAVENHCSADVCPAPLACVDDQCRTECTGASDCLAGVCEGMRCAEPVSGVDAGTPIDAAVVTDAAQPIDALVPADTFAPSDAGLCVGAMCAQHVVISEVLPASGVGGFVELYARDAVDVDLGDCVVEVVDHLGAVQMIPIPTGTIVRSHGYLLIGGSGVASPDVAATSMFSIDSVSGGVQLFCGATPLDTLGWTPAPALFESTPAPAPSAGQSLERKASMTSTESTLAHGGSEELAGNGYETDDNAADFVIQPTPGPQSSASPHEP